jgi:hypothetical protein
MRRLSTLGSCCNDVERYYLNMFLFIEEYIDQNKRLLFEEEENKILKHLRESPPKFPIVKYIELDSKNIEEVDAEWIEYERCIKNVNQNFVLQSKHFPFSISFIINKVMSPPIIGCFMGLLIGMSGMRDILFSPNHYIANLVEGIYVVTKTTVPFLYTALGISMLSIKNLNFNNTPLSKKYIIVSFIIRFLILPGIGLVYVYLWKTYYGGIVAESKVFRISMFIPFCLPASATAVVVVNIVDFFREESGLILFCHNISMMVTLTILYLVYFVVIEAS